MTDVPATIWTNRARGSDGLLVHMLGTVDFDSALYLQERLVYELADRSDRMGGLLICEHPPLVTIGREGSRADLPPDLHDLEARQTDVRWLSRGGGTVVHGSGQLAVYAMLPLDRLGLGLVEFRQRLEAAVIDAGRELDVPAERDARSPGVWSRGRQFAFVGAAVRSWVSFHGLFVNVAPDMQVQRLVDRRLTSIAAERQRPVSMHTVRESLVRNLASRFGYADTHLFTGHPLLKRTRKKIHVPA